MSPNGDPVGRWRSVVTPTGAGVSLIWAYRLAPVGRQGWDLAVQRTGLRGHARRPLGRRASIVVDRTVGTLRRFRPRTRGPVALRTKRVVALSSG